MMNIPPIHQCNLHCHAMDPMQVENMGIKDPGKWLPFSIHMDIIVGCKLTSDDRDESTYNCTTLYTEQGDSFIIDTPYYEFNPLFIAYNSPSVSKGSEPAAEL